MSCGEIISQAVGNQTELLMQATGKTLEELDFKFNLWYAAPLPPQPIIGLSTGTRIEQQHSRCLCSKCS